MGKLRKFGRKLKKGIRKVMGSKIGRIVGMIGLSMAMGYAAKGLMTGMQGATTAATTSLPAAVPTAVPTVGAAVPTVGETVVATSTPLLEEITVSAVKRPVLESMAAATTKSEAGAIALEHTMADTVASNGMVNPDAFSSIHNNITDSIVELNETVFNPDYQNSLASENLFSQDIPSLSEALESGTLTADLSGTTSITGGGVPQTSSLLDPTAGADIAQNITAPDISGKSLGVETYAPLRDRIAKFGRETIAGLDTPAEFATGVLQGTATGAAMDVIMGEPEESFLSKGVSTRLESVEPQAAYMQDITPSFQSAMNTDLKPTFQQFANAPLYGRGTPQFMEMFGTQPLVMPSMLGIEFPYRNTTAIG